MSEENQSYRLLPLNAFDIKGAGKDAPGKDDRQIQRLDLATGGNQAIAGWAGTVHNLKPADKAKNFRASLDRQRMVAHPQQAATGGAIVPVAKRDTGLDHDRLKPMDRSAEYEKRIAEIESRVAEAMRFVRQQQSPFQRVFPAGPNPDSPTDAKQWKEYSASGTNLVVFPDGRVCNDSSSPAAIMSNTNGAFILLEVPNGSNKAYIKFPAAPFAVLRLIPGQIGVFGTASLGTSSGGEENPLTAEHGVYGAANGGYRAVVLYDPEGIMVAPFANGGSDPNPDGSGNYEYNAVYYNLDENGNQIEIVNPFDMTHPVSNGKWLTDNLLAYDGGSVVGADGSVDCVVVGMRVDKVDDQGRPCYVGTGGRASLAYRELVGGGTSDYWLRGGVNSQYGTLIDPSTGATLSTVGAAGFSVTFTDSTTGNRVELRFDASGKCFRAHLLSNDTGDIAYSDNNPPPP